MDKKNIFLNPNFLKIPIFVKFQSWSYNLYLNNLYNYNFL